MREIRRESCCKINLFLKVLRKRPDGFHDIETVFQPIPIYDYLTFSRKGNGIRIICNNPALPNDSRNLVYKAADAFLKEIGKNNEGIEIQLDKRLPLSAGLGAGSSNAANTLLGLNELFGFPLDSRALYKLAAQLGSDAPFFLEANPALARGRGEILQRLQPFPSLKNACVLLIYPGFGVSTAWAYKKVSECLEKIPTCSISVEQFVQSLINKPLEESANEFYNVFEIPVFKKFPILQIFKEFLKENGAVVSMMSGSGSTTFAILKSRDNAESLKERFINRFGSSNWIAMAQL